MHAFLAYETIPLYLAFVGTLSALIVGFSAIYSTITPFNEISLIRRGNRAAALSFAGTKIGIALPLAVLATRTSDITVLAMWGAVALVMQLVAYGVAALVLRDVKSRMESDTVSYGIAIGGFSIAIGLINAGSLT